jgi:hypothetical protein
LSAAARRRIGLGGQVGGILLSGAKQRNELITCQLTSRCDLLPVVCLHEADSNRQADRWSF